MQITEYIDLFIGAFINMMLYIIVIKKTFKLKLNSNKTIIYLTLIIASILISIINIYNKDSFKILMTIPITVLMVKLILNSKINLSFYYVVIALFYMFLAEIMTGIFFSLLPVNYTYVFNNVFGKTIGNIVVSIFTFVFISIKPLSILSNKIVEKIKNKQKIIIVFIIICAIGAFGYKNGISVETPMKMITNIVIILIFLAILRFLYNESEKSKELSKNYNVLLKYLEKYEEELNNKRKIVHDYKNQLIVINGYANTSNKKLKEYISEIIEEQKKIPETSIIKNVDKLPRGIKGLVYYKLSNFDKTINIEINVINNLKKYDTISPKLNKEVLKALGILLDNAIEAVSELDKKYIEITMSITSNIFEIRIKNNINVEIDNSRLMQSGYSTKGKNRGYGLSIINDIIKNNKEVNVNINSSANFFEAILNIKL